MISNHLLNSWYAFPEDSSLKLRRKRQPKIDQEVLFKCYFGPCHEDIERLRSIAESSLNFDHSKESLLSYEQQRGNTLKQIADLYFTENCSYEIDLKNPEKKINMLIVLAEYDISITTRIIVHSVLYIDTLQNLSTEKHLDSIKKAYSLEEYGCFAMTELGHGSNVLALETTAEYINETRQFNINSPTATSAKWWIGAASKTATKAVLFAQLIVDGNKQGVHAFLIPIRNQDHVPYNGVILGDCGPKISQDRIDNGFILFFNYKVPYDALLDRFSFITADGKFKSSIKNSEKRLGAMLGGLIRGRAAVCCSSEITLRSSLKIALRFTSVRHAHILDKSSAMIDNPIVYTKLMPCLSRLFALRVGTLQIIDIFSKNHKKYREDPECEELTELHAILSSLKVVTSWLCIESLQVIQEVCGRFSLYDDSALGRIRNNQDINATWEGDNTVLIQQVGKYALKIVQRTYKGHSIQSKIFAELYMTYENTNEAKSGPLNFKGDLSVELLNAIKFKFNYFLYQTIQKLQEKSASSGSVIEAWNNTQAFYIQDLGKALGEYLMAERLLEFSRNIEGMALLTGKEVRKIANLFCIDRIICWLFIYQENYFTYAQIQGLKTKFLKLCSDLKESAINIIEAIGPSDKLIHSNIGTTDGQIYSQLCNLHKE